MSKTPEHPSYPATADGKPALPEAALQTDRTTLPLGFLHDAVELDDPAELLRHRSVAHAVEALGLWADVDRYENSPEAAVFTLRRLQGELEERGLHELKKPELSSRGQAAFAALGTWDQEILRPCFIEVTEPVDLEHSDWETQERLAQMFSTPTGADAIRDVRKSVRRFAYQLGE